MRLSRGTILLAVCLGIMVASVAMADTTVTITDNTIVQEWNGNSIYGGGAWTDVIGDPIFNTTQIAVTLYTNGNVGFKIYTPFPAAGSSVPGIFVPAADLAIDLGSTGTFNKGIVLSGTGAGLYDVSTWYSAEDLWSSKSAWIYGGRDDSASNPGTNPRIPYTEIHNGTNDNLGTNFSVNQLTGEIDVILKGVNSTGAWDNFSFFWGTGTCDNDGIAGQIKTTGTPPVPEPATMLLLGFGVAGLVGLRRKLTK